jgi:glycosyltransferase involved in cell wall biosynthesis
LEKALRICFLIINPFDYDSRARLICRDIIESGYELDIITSVGNNPQAFAGAAIHRIAQHTKPFRQRRFIEFNSQAAEIAGKLQPDIIHAVDLDTLWAAITAAKRSGGKVVYEARELYTELLSLHRRPVAKFFWRTLEKRLINKADRVVTINHSIAEELSRRYDIAKPAVVMNVDKSESVSQVIDIRREFDFTEKYILIYQGVLRPGQGIERALHALKSIPDAGILFVGEGPYRARVEAIATQLNIKDKVKFAGMIQPEQLPSFTAAADAGLLLMESTALNNYLALPQKLFQYIMAGTPPIVSDLPELKRIVEADDLGLVLKNGSSSEDSRAISDFLQKELAKSARNCHKVISQYCWEVEGKKLMDIYRSLAG